MPSKIVAIHHEIKRTKFAEDFYMEKPPKRKVKRVKGATPKKAIPPSKRYEEHVEAFLQGAEPTAEVVLGFYFKLYKRFFHEEDPEWAGISSHKAITMIDKLAIEVIDGDYRKVVNYIRKIMPLWVDRLKHGYKFPNSRPTITSLFGSSRYFWTNRNLLYRQWQNE